VAGPTVDSVLVTLSKPRLAELARDLGVLVPTSASKEAHATKLVETTKLPLPAWLGYFVRDELREACRKHGIETPSRSRVELADALLDAAGLPRRRDTIPPLPAQTGARSVPKRGDIVVVRHRQYLVDAVHDPIEPTDATRIALIGIDDDNQGRRTEVLWELELGAAVLDPTATSLESAERLDPPRHFGAYYNALRWNRVTATDAKLFQAPFRAGAKLMLHQLTPLKRALDLPRANLFIADDVGLGKTIEAGLVLQELLLRNQVEVVLIVAPASVCPQWQREMARRFGLQFEIYNRPFVQRRRQDRGFGVNPWCTHARFIISYQTLRRPEYQGPLHAMLAEGDRRTLLILDEAHTAAPSSSSNYAIPSETTRVIQQLAPLFDHRLFLSATPHNGHSNSFSTLLSLLDRQRFTRGVKADPRALEQVMVRRLKSDLRAMSIADGFPEREVVALSLTTNTAPEIELARLLAEYTALATKTARDRLVYINLQKRLLSCVRAFARTLEKHANPGGGEAVDATELDDEEDVDDDLREAADAAVIAARSRRMVASPEAAQLLERMLELALRHRDDPDAKLRALLSWIEKHPDQRVIVFTEYGDTKNYLRDQLDRTLDDAADRVMTFHGGMSDQQRELVQRAFNAPLDEHPVRILIATDAAREGLNLQAHCADLFHYDVPWNPARMEQRNGRIDRALQPSPVVRCYYFVYEHRPEDRVLDALVKKVGVIHRELGSLATVVLDDVERALARGIDERSLAALEGVGADDVRVAVVTNELEEQRDRRRLERDIEENKRIVNSSREVINFDPYLLKETLDVGLAIAGTTGLEPADGIEGGWQLPPLPDAWQRTLDTVRAPRERDEDFWDWRARPPLPIVFEPPDAMREDIAHLHLSHPVTQRILSRFLAQGFSARDLSRVTALVADVVKPSVLALGRLSLFGGGAERLHDELIAVGALWDEDKRGKQLKALDDKESWAMREALHDYLLDRTPKAMKPAHEKTLLDGCDADFAALWPAIEEEADAEEDRAKKMLANRARTEAAAMRELLRNQQHAIVKELDTRKQQTLELSELHERLAYDADTKAMQERLGEIEIERDREPARIEALYDVALRRLTPVGLVYLWPKTEKRR